jgi:hypothetical protein
MKLRLRCEEEKSTALMSVVGIKILAGGKIKRGSENNSFQVYCANAFLIGTRTSEIRGSEVCCCFASSIYAISKVIIGSLLFLLQVYIERARARLYASRPRTKVRECGMYGTKQRAAERMPGRSRAIELEYRQMARSTLPLELSSRLAEQEVLEGPSEQATECRLHDMGLYLEYQSVRFPWDGARLTSESNATCSKCPLMLVSTPPSRARSSPSRMGTIWKVRFVSDHLRGRCPTRRG